MGTQESKARITTQIDEWQRDLKTMKAKVEAAAGDSKVEYQERVNQLGEQFDDFKLRAAKLRDEADEKWDSGRKDFELQWDEWQLRAKRAWQDLVDGEPEE
jgi:predicted  nucleic acid-binding Zn-ribbon protein